MSALVWGIKASLLDYVRGMPDGAVDTSGGVTVDEGGAFVFPRAAGADAAHFVGTVTLSGHDGMMHVVIADPRLEAAASGRVLTIADDAGERLVFATVAQDGATALTADGADLFFGPYREGTPLDPVRLDG